MSEHARYERSVRCMGLTREKKRCIKDASYDIGNKCYCNTHYRNALLAREKEKKNVQKTVG